MTTFGRSVGCGTGSTRTDEGRSVPLGDVHDFYGKKHRDLGEPIRITGQGVAYVARYPTVSAGFWRRAISAIASIGRELLRIVLRGQRLVDHGVAAAKGWWHGGTYQGHEDLRGHGGTRVYMYRRWFCFVLFGLQLSVCLWWLRVPLRILSDA